MTRRDLQSRIIALVAVAGLVLTATVTLFAGSAQAAPLPSWERCGDYSVEFDDVSKNNVHCQNIIWLRNQEITKTSNPKRYMPGGKVNRGSMTAFLYRLENPHLAEPKCSARPFSDVSTTHKFCGHIAWAKKTAVTTGVGDGTRFAPNSAVTRGAMVAFLHRISTGGAKQPKCTSKPFSDVPTNHKFCGYIAWAKQNKITTGVGDGKRFAPSSAVTRGAMASFIKRVFDYRWPTSFTEGTFRVGADVKPGIYRTKVPSTSMCYWARLDGTSEWNDIIANGLPQTYGLMEVKSSDKYVHSSDCGTWRLASETPNWNFRSGKIPGSGEFLVGKDVAPGEYRQNGHAGGQCYWERSSDATGDFGTVIENGLTGGQAYVTIRSSDVAFRTSGCSEWIKVN